MTDSYFEDRSIDHNPDIENWSIEGDKEDRQRQQAIIQKGYDDERAEMAQYEADYKDYEGRVQGVKEELKELNALKEKLLPLLKEIKEKEEWLIEQSYGWIWVANDDPQDYRYDCCDSEDEKKIVDLELNYDYEVITPWIDQYTPIAEEMEIQRKKAENLRQHKEKFGITDEITDEKPF